MVTAALLLAVVASLFAAVSISALISIRRNTYDAAKRLNELAHVFGNRRDIVVTWDEFGGTSPMWSVAIWPEHFRNRKQADRPRRLGYAATLPGAIEDAFESVERAKRQTALNPDFDLHY
jgi:hypothetical protein